MGRHHQRVDDEHFRLVFSSLGHPLFLLDQGHLYSAVAGVGLGALFGLFGLALTQWEAKPEGLFYTPSRWLALFLTLAIAARFAYGWWRGLYSAGPHPFLSASGMQLSLAVGGGLIGYYLAFAIGVRLRLARHERDRAG